jgi:hypothetical protein
MGTSSEGSDLEDRDEIDAQLGRERIAHPKTRPARQSACAHDPPATLYARYRRRGEFLISHRATRPPLRPNPGPRVLKRVEIDGDRFECSCGRARAAAEAGSDGLVVYWPELRAACTAKPRSVRRRAEREERRALGQRATHIRLGTARNWYRLAVSRRECQCYGMHSW